MSQPVLKAKDLTKVYDLGQVQIHALRGISMEIFKGELLAILGKSGSGKSTLMHILGLLDTPTGGQITLKDRITTDYSEKELAKLRNKEIGFVFQQFNLLRRATALDNVMLPLKYSEVPKKDWEIKAKEMLERVGLGDRMSNKSNELSGGQKQRVAVARALINEPSIIFADEPTGNLDTKTGEEIVTLFKTLNKEGKTLVIVTHDEDVAAIAQRQIVLSDGVIVNSK